MEAKTEFWGIIELFGHTTTAGKISEQKIGDEVFIRVDIPITQPLSKLYGKGAIYSITPTSEDVVKLFVKRFQPKPLNIYMPEIKQLPQEDSDSEMDSWTDEDKNDIEFKEEYLQSA